MLPVCVEEYLYWRFKFNRIYKNVFLKDNCKKLHTLIYIEEEIKQLLKRFRCFL